LLSERNRPLDARALLCLLTLLIGAACQSAAPAPVPPAARSAPSAAAPASPAAAPAPAAAGEMSRLPSDWDQLVAAARQEGQVVVYGPPGQEYRTAIVDGFQRAYPGIAVNAIFISPTERLSRLGAERAAGRYLADVWIGGTNPAVTEVKEAKYSIPLQPALVLPEVLDPAAWLDQRLWWSDSAEPYTNLMFQGSSQAFVAINTQLVGANEITSYWDLLAPKWKGKIVANDIRRPGPGGVPTRFIYKSPELGPTFITRLFSEMDVMVTADPRQLVDWLAQGTYAIGIFMAGRDILVGARQGLPIDVVPPERFKEGSSIGPGNGSLVMLDQAPHPNAAKLYVNWLLSREGQRVWQEAIEEPSLRVDIPKEGLAASAVPKPGISYVNAAGEEYTRLASDVIIGLVNQALQQSSR
jgi:ABC-type Fe3+ transport system substrate-binding protein